MKKPSLLKIVIPCLLFGVLLVFIENRTIDFSLIYSKYRIIMNFSLFKYLIFLGTFIAIIYFSFRYYYRSLKKIEINYQQLFNGSPLATYVMSLGNLKFLAVNKAMTELYGYTEREFLQMSVFDIRPKEEHKRFQEFVDTKGESGPESGIWLHQKKNGDRFFVRFKFHSAPLIRKDAVLVMITDVDKSVNDEKKIKHLVHLYETVNKATHDVIWDYDLLTDKLYWMQGYEETYGYTNELSPDNFWAMKKVQKDDRKQVQQAFRDIVANKQTEWVVEYRYICADNSIKYVRDRGYMIFDHQGEPVRLIGAMQDIDKQKRFEKMLLDQNEQLKEIAWINSHEVRRPLSNILGLIDLIKEAAEHKEDIIPLVNLLAISSKELNDAVILINKQTIEGET